MRIYHSVPNNWRSSPASARPRPRPVAKSAIKHHQSATLQPPVCVRSVIFQDLQIEVAFTGSYESVKRFVGKLRQTRLEMVCRIEVEPAEEVQVDFGAGPMLVGAEGKRYRTWIFRMADVFSHYIRHPVFRCYTRRDADDPPTDYECAVRTVQYDMWAVVHRHILPVYARFLPPDERPCPELNHYLVLFSGAVPNRYLLGGRSVARIGSRTLAVLFPKARGDHQPLHPTGLDKYLDSCQRQHPAIESLAESLLRWFQAHGRICIRRGCRCGPRLPAVAEVALRRSRCVYRGGICGR